MDSLPPNMKKNLVRLYDQRQFDILLVELRAVLREYPSNALAWNLAGEAFRQRGRVNEAITAFQQVIKLTPDYYGAYNNLGIIFAQQGALDGAAWYFDRAVALNPDVMFPLFQGFYHKRSMCDWSDAEAVPLMIDRLVASKQAVPPWALLFAEDDPANQRLHSKVYGKSLSINRPASRPKRKVGDKIRIGYFSADIHSHATAYLIAGLLRHHDRNKFEVFIYSYGHTKDEWTQKISDSADRFVDGSKMSDPELTAMARKDKLDIAIDLKGYTKHARLGMFREGIAPVQITYLGYPGTLASPCFDYAIVDEVVVPQREREHYTENLIFMPHSYQCTDNERPVSEKKTSRADWGLPAQSTVFCCFNHSAKICPEVFGIWMNVLRNVEGSVLWLLASNKWAKENLRREAEQRGINPDRIVFAPKIPQDEHLARLRHADLFLDTFAYNAHTTASDALYMGLPIVTKAGRQFAARVGASLLKAVGLPELVTETVAEYEALAVALASDKQRHSDIRAELIRTRMQSPLFDTTRFTRHFESGLTQAFQKQVAGDKLADITVRDGG